MSLLSSWAQGNNEAEEKAEVNTEVYDSKFNLSIQLEHEHWQVGDASLV